MAQGRQKEAKALLERAARENGKSLPSGSLVTEEQKNRFRNAAIVSPCGVTGFGAIGEGGVWSEVK